MMKDNFSNPNPFLSHAKQFQELVNQPTAADAMAGAFSKGGSQPAQGPQQRGANAFMNGIASGIQGAENQRRQEKLSPILEQAGQITAKAAELEAQAQQEQGRQFAVQEYGRKYTPLVATFAELVDKGDPRSSMVFEDLISKAGSIPGYENLKAERWDAATGTGWALNTRTGEYRKITADEIISVIAPSAQAIYGDKWFEKFLPLNAGVAKDAQYAFNTNRQATELGLTEKRADIANKYSQANVHNTQAEKTKHEMNAPKPKYSEGTLNTFAKQNSEWINNNREDHRRLKQQIQANEDIAKYIEEEVKAGFGRAGSGALAKIQRGLNKANTESEKNQVLIQYANQPLMKGLKDIFTGVTSDGDIALYIEGLPSLDKNPEATIQVAKERAAEMKKRIKEDEVTQEILEDEFGYSEPYNSLAVQRKVKEKLPPEEHGKTVLMTAPDGTTKEVPIDKVEYFKKKGAKIANE